MEDLCLLLLLMPNKSDGPVAGPVAEHVAEHFVVDPTVVGWHFPHGFRYSTGATDLSAVLAVDCFVLVAPALGHLPIE